MEITAFNQLRFWASNQDQDRFSFCISSFCGLRRLGRLYAIHIHCLKALFWNTSWLQWQVPATSHSNSFCLVRGSWETVYYVSSFCVWTGYVTIVALFSVGWAICSEDFIFIAWDLCQKAQDSWVKHLCSCFLYSNECSCNGQRDCIQLPSEVTMFVQLLSACVLSLFDLPIHLNTSQESQRLCARDYEPKLEQIYSR